MDKGHIIFCIIGFEISLRKVDGMCYYLNRHINMQTEMKT